MNRQDAKSAKEISADYADSMLKKKAFKAEGEEVITKPPFPALIVICLICVICGYFLGALGVLAVKLLQLYVLQAILSCVSRPCFLPDRF